MRSSWESPEIAQREKRPPRRYYTVNARGLEVLETARQEIRAMVERPVKDAKPAATATEPTP